MLEEEDERDFAAFSAAFDWFKSGWNTLFIRRFPCTFVLLGCNRPAPPCFITRDDSSGDYSGLMDIELLIGSVG